MATVLVFVLAFTDYTCGIPVNGFTYVVNDSLLSFSRVIYKSFIIGHAAMNFVHILLVLFWYFFPANSIKRNDEIKGNVRLKSFRSIQLCKIDLHQQCVKVPVYPHPC